MTAQEQENNQPKKSRANRLRWLVIYPVVWIVVSVILFYLVRIN